MNSIRRNLNQFTRDICLLVVCSGLLVACGSSSDSSDTTAGIGGTGIVSGEITGFGSVHVNGGKFETDSSLFDVDGNTIASQGDLALGMVITLEVETENGVYTGNALRVFYDDEVEGPVSAVGAQVGTTKTITVFGQTITIDETSTLFENTTFFDIAVDDVVEVSGFRVSPTQINATYLEETAEDVDFGSTEVELRGVIGSYNAGPPEMFVLDTVTVNTDGFTEVDVSGPLQNGLNVEVKGIIQTPTSVLAKKIEEEDEDFDDDVDDISLQGIISMFNNIADFEIDGQAINASQVSPANMSPANAASLLGDGVEVEVEGDIVNSVLIADELELREGESKLRTVVSAINLANSSFEVNYPPLAGSVVVITDGQTLFEDEGPLQLPNFSLELLGIGDFVEVEGIANNGSVNAQIVKRKNPKSSKLQGPVEAFLTDTSITILGITYPVDVAAEYEEGGMTSAQFFGLLQVGDLVEMEDDEPADGDADEIEFE
jgi:hypothetical protein